MATIEEQRTLLKTRQAQRTARLRPLFLQCAELLDSKILGANTSVKIQEGVKNLPDAVKEQLFSQMSAHQLGRHYQVLLGKFISVLKVMKWPIEDYSLFFQCLAQECPYLEHLHIHATPFQATCVPSLRTLLQTVSLKSFSFTEQSKGISGECMRCILQNAPALTSLSLNSLKLYDADLQYLPTHPSLTQLRLFDCFRISYAGLECIKSCKKLRHLMLRLNKKWTNEEMASFCGQDGCTQLESLDLDRIAKHTVMRIHLPNLTTLKLDNSLTEIEAFELKCPELRKLSLQLNITNGEMIAKEIPALTKLVSFHLREDQYNNVDFSEIVRNLGKQADIKRLKLPCMNGYVSPQVLSSLDCSLENLAFMNIAEISDEIIKAFSKHLPNLRKLKVANSSLVRPVFDFPNLEYLDASDITTQVWMRVNCPNLNGLDVSNSPILERVEWECPNLAVIYMASLEKFTNEEMCKMTSACQNLAKVMMSKLPNVTDDVAVALCTLPRLQTLNISDCPQVTAKTMEQLAAIFPRISIF
eukprot:Phypoly_transcript_05310.p1 GENE.Phypoly_transcript_05310~~Phypoly_transcript_05310.p1  ORF type:complete len:529 (+),score=60.14 Phypoly_transcript_05310:351-1937(+)